MLAWHPLLVLHLFSQHILALNSNKLSLAIPKSQFKTSNSIRYVKKREENSIYKTNSRWYIFVKMNSETASIKNPSHLQNVAAHIFNRK